MSSRRWSTALLSLGAATFAVAAALATAKSPVAPSTEPRIGALPPNAVAPGKFRNPKRHLERLRQAIPGFAGQMVEGPGSADDAVYYNRAYPDTDIALTKIQTARTSYNTVYGRGFNTSKKKPGTWFSVGPTNALYQFTPFRNTYVPNQYSASGRVTAMAIAPTCTAPRCAIWVAAAGGGLWRTKVGLAGTPGWKFLTASFGIQAIGSIEVDPSDPAGETIWVGTGEANASGDSAAGVGLYKSTNGGDTWSGPYGVAEFNGRSIGSVQVDPNDSNVIYAATTRGVRGVSSVSGGAVSLTPGAAKWGLYKSSDGGASWTFIHNGFSSTAPCTGDATEANGGTPCSPRGVRRVEIDPVDSNILYAGSYARGVWRSNDGGTTWTQILTPLTTGSGFTDRPEIAATLLPNGKTRLYVGEGAQGVPYSRLFRSDDVATGIPVFSDLTSSNPADPGYGSFDYCTGQCWYDNMVVTPAGHPDIVYVGGSYLYNEDLGISNGRAVLLSTDAGVSFTDVTKDATDAQHPNGLHPDQHALVVNPNNPLQFWSGSDGGVMRASGSYADVSANCDSRGLVEPALSRCKQLLSRVPTKHTSNNKGLVTLQFQSLSVSPHNPILLQGGTQDNGTFQKQTNVTWPQTIWGDGGQSGFDIGDPAFRFHTFFNATPDVNFSSGLIADWNWIGDRLFGVEPQAFYIPMISDPKVSQTLWAGLAHVWRTKTNGVGAMSLDEFRQHCNEFTGDFTIICGDWEPLATTYTFPTPPSATRLTGTNYGADRLGGTVAAVERTTADSSTLWAATSLGRVFVSKNADLDPASAVTFTRIDPLSGVDPARFVSGIYVDPANANRAWLSYSGYSASTPTTPGHVFEVVYDPSGGSATWTSLDNLGPGLGDIPLTDVVRDDFLGDLYVSSDFGVMRNPADNPGWVPASQGMPTGEIAGLTIVQSGARRLYAATHGMGAWSMNLP
jgi:hypothetical protein